MVTRLGMSTKPGRRVVGGRDEPADGRLPLGLAPAYSEELAREIDLEIAAVLGEARLLAADLLRLHEADLHRLATALIEHETINRDELEPCWEPAPRARLRPRRARRPAASCEPGG